MNKPLNKKAILTGKRKIILVDGEIPKPEKNEVLVKVAYCGICGSDIPRYFEGRVHYFPLILGHEFSAEIIETNGSEKFAKGDKVVGIPLIPCKKCKECLDGHFQLCANYSFFGSREDGAFQQYIKTNECNLIKLPSNVSLKEAALIEPLTVAIHAYLELKDKIKQNSRILIYGFGNIGVLLSKYLTYKGFKDISVLTHSTRMAKEAQKVKIKNYWLLSENLEGKEYFDIVFDCSSASTSLNRILPLLSPKGIVSIIGSKADNIEISNINFNWIQRKEALLVGAWMSYSSPWPGEEWQEACHFLSKSGLSIEGLITKEYSLEEINQAFEASVSLSPKILINMSL